MQHDVIFGDIDWTGGDWTTHVTIPQLRGYGARKQLTKEDVDELGPEGKFKLTIDTGGIRKRPTEPQRIAWMTILKRKNAIWDDVLDALVCEYRLQRATRACYWKTLRGNTSLGKSLPAIVDREVMRQLVRPLWFGIHAPDKVTGTVDCYLSLLATWWSEGVNVYIRDGRVLEVTPLGSMHNRKLPCIVTSVFGTLRRQSTVSKKPWIGEAMLATFRPFAAIAVDRSVWDEAYTRRITPESDLPWEVARGGCSLWVYADSGKQPTAKQAATFEAFRSSQKLNGSSIIDAVFEYYQQTFRERRIGYLSRGDPSPPDPVSDTKNAKKYGKGALRQAIGVFFETLLDTAPAHKLSRARRRALQDHVIPKIENRNRLGTITELVDVNIFPDKGAKSGSIGFVFAGPWIGDIGLGLRWRKGEVGEIGSKQVAIP